ncbi:SRPBCC family protein [Paenibacillus soyae]|uniref:SRPBCC family protein n=1 Tax=Paenibacillus soyae TaxID=2969249 RepID=A0A9X2SB65_9BACL|nr:SRPBCC family protein [Paenibacillus soyae]MCR2806976.1 SRPBCC family protein [Paenibacillus soyae]
MIEWKEEMKIPAPIEKVWSLFSDEHIKRIMPNVEEHTLIEGSGAEAGSKHRQSYREGKRVETYIVDTLAYEDENNRKHKRIRFVLGKAFEVMLSFTLERLDDSHSKLIYEGHNKGVNFVGRAMLRLGSEKANNKVVQEFLQRVAEEAAK